MNDTAFFGKRKTLSENTYEIYYFEQRKVDKKLANGHAEQLLEKVPHNSE